MWRPRQTTRDEILDRVARFPLDVTLAWASSRQPDDDRPRVFAASLTNEQGREDFWYVYPKLTLGLLTRPARDAVKMIRLGVIDWPAASPTDIVTGDNVEAWQVATGEDRWSLGPVPAPSFVFRIDITEWILYNQIADLDGPLFEEHLPWFSSGLEAIREVVFGRRDCREGLGGYFIGRLTGHGPTIENVLSDESEITVVIGETRRGAAAGHEFHARWETRLGPSPTEPYVAPIEGPGPLKISTGAPLVRFRGAILTPRGADLIDTVDVEPGRGAQPAATDDPEEILVALDHLDAVWKNVFRENLLRKPAELADVGSLMKPVTSAEEYEGRLSDLVMLLDTIRVADSLLPSERPVPVHRLKRMELALTTQLGEDADAAVQAVRRLRALLRLRAAQQHGAERPRRFAALGRDYPPTDWTQEWRVDLGTTRAAIDEIRRTVRRYVRGDDG